MEAKKLLTLFKKRKKDLINLYAGKGEISLNLSRQHQVYGALNELNLIIDVLELSLPGARTRKKANVVAEPALTRPPKPKRKITPSRVVELLDKTVPKS